MENPRFNGVLAERSIHISCKTSYVYPASWSLVANAENVVHFNFLLETEQPVIWILKPKSANQMDSQTQISQSD